MFGVFVAGTFFGAIFDFVPDFSPFFAILKESAADGADFGR